MGCGSDQPIILVLVDSYTLGLSYQFASLTGQRVGFWFGRIYLEHDNVSISWTVGLLGYESKFP